MSPPAATSGPDALSAGHWHVAVQQGQDAGEVRVCDQEPHLVFEPAQPVGALTALTATENLDCPARAIVAADSPNVAVSATTDASLPGCHPLPESLTVCTPATVPSLAHQLLSRGEPPRRRRSHQGQGLVKPTRSVLPAKLSLVTVSPGCGASIIMSLPGMTMPTWPGLVIVPSPPAKKTRSPCLAWLAGICLPKAHCCWLVRGTVMPAAR